MDPTPRRFLDRLRGTLRRVLVLDGLARLLGWTLLAATFVLVLDRMHSLPGPVRLVLLGGVLAVAATVSYRRLVRPLGQRFDDAVLARIAERREGNFNGRLFAAVDGLALSEADRKRLDELCGSATIGRLIRNDGMVRALSGAALLLITLGTFGAVKPGSMWIAVQRLLLPLGQAEWPRSHQLSAVVEQAVVPADQPLVIAAEGTGSSAPLRMTWTDNAGVSETRIPDALTGPWRERLNLPAGAYSIELRWADSLPVLLNAQVVERPVLSSISASITPPAYADLPVREVPAPAELAVLPGSQIDLQFSVADLSADSDAERQVVERRVKAWLGDQALKLAAVEVVEGEQATATWQAQWTVTLEEALRLELRDSYPVDQGSVDVPARPEPQIPIHLLTDRVPLVRLSGPRRNETVTPNAIIPLAITANDDYGLAGLQLQASILDEGVDEGKAASETADMNVLADWPEVAGVRGETARRHDFRVGEFVGPGRQVVLMAEASDANDVSGPGIGRSDPLLLRVVTTEELRQELDRVITEIRDRLIQSRDQLSPGLTDSERLQDTARVARPVAERAIEQLDDLVRRWNSNGLDVEDVNSLQDVRATLADEVVPGLRTAADDKDVEQATVADRALGESERALTRLLRSDDLARDLSSLLNRQRQVSEASRELLRKQLAGELDEAGEQQLADLSRRQQEVADQLREWVRRLLSNEDESLGDARDLARSQQPAAALQRAAEALAADRGRQQALAEQAQAQTTMEQILDQLRGEDAAKELADMAGDLAARQERLQELLEAGADPESLAAEQERLQEETAEFQERVQNETDNEEAAESAQAAQSAQQQAQEAMQQGNQSGAAREAQAAAAQLRAAQRELGEQDGEQGEQGDQQEEENPVTDIVALLRRLRDDQVRIVTKATLKVDDGVGVDEEKIKNFRDRRAVLELAEQEEEIWLQLQADALQSLDQMPIALRALKRVSGAVEAAHKHLAKPALGRRGLRLTKIALYEMERLLEIVDTMPEGKPSQEGNQGQGGESSQAPFPPAAQLALIAAEQRELRQLTAANFPKDLAEAQGELLDIAASVAQMTRPGTRPNVLMQRAVRAMASAADLLEHGERGPTLLNEQDVAVDKIMRLLAEAESGGGGGGGSSSSGQNDQQQDGQSQQNQGDSGQQEGGEAEGAQSGGNEQGGDPGEGGETTRVVVGVEEAQLMHLSPRSREQLREALDDNIPAEGLHLYRAYLEHLEGLHE